MRVNYYILMNGILKRKQNTVYFVYKKDAANPKGEEKVFEAETTEGNEKELKIEAEEKVEKDNKYGTPVHFYNY